MQDHVKLKATSYRLYKRAGRLETAKWKCEAGSMAFQEASHAARDAWSKFEAAEAKWAKAWDKAGNPGFSVDDLTVDAKRA